MIDRNYTPKLLYESRTCVGQRNARMQQITSLPNPLMKSFKGRESSKRLRTRVTRKKCYPFSDPSPESRKKILPGFGPKTYIHIYIIYRTHKTYNIIQTVFFFNAKCFNPFRLAVLFKRGEYEEFTGTYNNRLAERIVNSYVQNQ